MIATAGRVLRQLRHDPRTIALLVVVPSLLMLLLRYVFDSRQTFSHLAPALLGIFPFLLMFLVTSIATLRERTSGTLERLMTTPLSKLSLLAGYGAAFSLVALLQVAVTTGVSLWLGLHVAGSLAWLIAVTFVDALLGAALGLLASAFAATEFQAIQLMPVVVLPQILLCGLFQPRDDMATVLRWAADALPVSYAVEALQQVATASSVGTRFGRDLVVLIAFAGGALIAAAATLRRRHR
jgi:ABC-2 type transport system permease protein